MYVMTSIRVTITDPVGLHARPAAKFVETVRKSGLPVRVRRLGGPPVDASSVLALLSMGVKGGEEIELLVDDQAADAAGAVLAEIAATLVDRPAGAGPANAGPAGAGPANAGPGGGIPDGGTPGNA
jgi:phosphocarrier protein HPr